MERNVTIVKDLKGQNIVLINDIYFKGRQNIEWNEVEKYLKQYVGEFIEIIDSNDIVYIGADLADEYTGSKYTISLLSMISINSPTYCFRYFSTSFHSIF